MEKLIIHKNTSSVNWKPSPIIALATSINDSEVAAAREDGSLEIWLVSPGSVGWHCQLTIHGDPNSRVSSLVWCPSNCKTMPAGRLLSSSIDGSISEWDLFHLKQKILLDSIGASIWQMAIEPLDAFLLSTQNDTQRAVNEHAVNGGSPLSDDGTSESDDVEDDVEINAVELHPMPEHPRLAIGCDDGRVRIYIISDELTYNRTLPRVSGRVLSVAWSPDAKSIFSGSSDGFIRCWDAQSTHEVYRITVGMGGLHNRSDLCVWSLIYLKSGTLVSGDSTGSVQFWDGEQGTLLQAHSCHKGDVNALAPSPSHNKVFSAGSDGQVIQYKLSSDTVYSGDDSSSTVVVKKWIYVGYVRAHTHDVRALTVACPIVRKEPLLDEKVKRESRRRDPYNFSYGKWAKLRVPMLISAGDDTKIFAYSAQEFTNFAPHDICPAPQRVPIQLVQNTLIDGASVILVQNSNSLDVSLVHSKSGKGTKRSASTSLLTSIKSRSKIICSTMSSSGMLFAYSDQKKPNLFQYSKAGENASELAKKKLPRTLPFAHSMVFSADSSKLILAGHDRKIYVVNVESRELLHTFTPCRRDGINGLPPSEPPITRMFASSDGQWLSAVNCFGDVYVFNLELQRQHWFISRLDGASVTAGGFMMTREYGIVLIITTSINRVYVFDVELKKLGAWSMRHTHLLPRRFQEFPGEIIGMSFPQSCSTAVIIYSARAICFIDFQKPVVQDDDDNCLADGVLDSSSEVSQDVAANGNGKVMHKRKRESQKKNFNFSLFKDPALFVGHLSESSLLVIEKPWREVVQTFEAPPVHRHIYGT